MHAKLYLEDSIMVKRSIVLSVAIALACTAGCSGGGQPSQNAPSNPSPPAEKKEPETKARESAPSDASLVSVTAFSAENDKAHWEQVSSGLSLLGKVTKGIDSSNSTPESPRFQYTVEVRMKNTGSSSIAHDATELAFRPAQGPPLRGTQTKRPDRTTLEWDLSIYAEASTGAPRETGGQDAVRTENLKKGQEKEWKVDTNGHTGYLLTKSEGKALLFEITLKSRGKTVAGPFRAELPGIEGLPAPGDQKSSSGVYLKFAAM
jgi:hypothetical protein